MLVSSLVIGGVLSAGTFGASLKAYQERKRKREYPWTVAAERMAKNKRPSLARRHGQKKPVERQKCIVLPVSPLPASAQALISKAQATSQAFTKQVMAPFVGDTRHQQLQEISSGEGAQISQAEQEAKRDLTIASGSLLLAIGASLFYAPLYVPSVLCTAYLCRFFLKETYKGIKKREVDIYGFSTLILVGGFLGGFFFTTTLGFWYANLMRLLLAKTEDHSRKSLVNLFGEQPRFVWVLPEENQITEPTPVEIEIPFSDLQTGNILVVMAGQTIAVDGIITRGEASIDQHMLTGEAQPAEKTVGEEVFASTVVLSGKIYVRVEKTGASTVAAQIGDILNRTTEFSLSIKSRFEAFQQKSLPALMGISLAGLPWLGLNGALAILWYAPGWRMLVLGPMSMLNFLHISSRQGILIKDGRSLELLSDVDIIVFDKTGTLTQEIPTVSQIYTLKGTENELLTLAAAAEEKQSHPIARAILAAAEARQLEIPKIDDAHIEMGYGVTVKLNDQVVRIGSQRFMEIKGITISPEILCQQESCHAQGYSLVYVAIDDELGGAIELHPTIRPEAKEVIRNLKERGKALYIISGDHEAPTRRLAQELGIDHYFANTLPENKANLVEQLQQDGRSVCFVGDGINDSIALKKANVSISLRGATTIATDTAQIVLMDESLEQLTSLFDIADEFKRNMDGSYVTTIVPNLIGIGGTLFFHWGFFSAVMFNTFLWLPQLAHVMSPLYKGKET